MYQTVNQAISILKSGGVGIFPTDTAFGVGCRIDVPDAVRRVFTIRNRPKIQALPILVCSKEQALTYFARPSDIVRRLMGQYWPGALTIVDVSSSFLANSPICGGGKTVGIRWPDHETAQALITGVGVPIVGPSANMHGAKTPYSTDDLDPELIKKVDFVLDGACKHHQPSTVVDCSVTPYQIIRQGAVTL